MTRALLEIAVGLGILAGAAASGARAQNYPWCSNFADGAGTNCGFSTEDQCRAAILGSGGYCDRNTQYRAPGITAPAQRKDHKHHAHTSSRSAAAE